ncbi:putative Manganese transport system, periplasmic binding component [Nitrospira lenta]|uniref:Putative Manganese transport system, periplasmic binding component n=2 Tax=Nitrospira lenta TaxID=1436998 RepID=A0A330L528_9BACT|nr:putative Manganese transport system, periplasmic binding component [Nitrospira lenta]
MLPSPPMFALIRMAFRMVCAAGCCLAVFLPSQALAATPPPLNVVVTIPVLKDLTQQVGGPYVHVTSLLSGYENEHTYAPKPSDLIAVRKARVLFEVGIGLEIWVAALVKNAGSPSLVVITTSDGIGLIRDHSDQETPHSGEHQHANGGNPHVWMDPESVATMLRHITATLISLDPAHAKEFRDNQAAYLRQLDQLRKELSERVKRLPDRRFIAHHPAWPYLARRFGFDIVATIQAQSGTEPSALQIQSLVAKIKKDHIKVIVSEIQLSQRIPELLAKETKTHVIVLTTLPGGLPGTETYLDMLRYNVLQLANALEAT